MRSSVSADEISHRCRQLPAGQDHAPRVNLVHQAEVVGRDDDGRAEPVQLDEQP
jgi:hypothetical protein